MAIQSYHRAKSRSAGWLVYQQIAGVLGAIALAALLGHLIDFDWRGFLGTVTGYWNEYVRPAVKLAFDLLISRPLEWAFGWHLEVPLPVRDYVSVGIITALSLVREVRRTEATLREILTPDSPIGLTVWLPIVPLIWPLTIGIFLLIELGLLPWLDRPRVDYFLVLSPLLYLGVLVAINYLVL